ncbi:MAG TPA: STAS domain-containing protein [Solirubrobacteraceae bacterium]|nr:STAS domain-containing protein [Solirubrobacteraceae bacterium]
MSGDDHTLILSGELDAIAGDELEVAIISCAKAAKLTLDLTGLTFMDSTALTLFLLARDLCKARGIVFALIPGAGHLETASQLDLGPEAST